MPAKQSYQVVARRFRPRAFAEVVGQDAVLGSIRGALASERIPHAFLFSGSRGVGKTTLARILARALNCEAGVSPDPCGACSACTTILAGNNPDVVEIDAASHNLVDDIRELRDRVGFASMGARYKVYILDEVHMLTRSAFNAFLKTLEEPPPGVVFIMATTELHKVPDTIQSRCQVLLFRRIAEDDIEARLRAICTHEGVDLPADVVHEIALTARGGMRDAETALERVLPMARELGHEFDLDAYRRIVHRVGLDAAFDVVEHLCAGEAAPALRFVDEVVQSGVDEREALGEVLDVLRAVLLLAIDGADSGLVGMAGALRERAAALASSVEVGRIDAMIQAGLIGRERIRRLEDRRLVLELTVVRMASAGQLPTLGALCAAIEAGGVVAAVPGGVAVAPAPAAEPPGSGDLKAALIAKIRRIKPMIVSTIELCDVALAAGGDQVVMVLRSPRKMHRDRLQSPDVQQLLREQLRELIGRDVAAVVKLQGARAAAPAPAAPGAEPGARTRQVADRFGGRVVERGE